ncbi:carcinoembryonic antigen-related cell adhesion molecule 5-like isoform X2 [Ruditapes philippinarum]|uniref:carcinoembryonic antigen-related cell adhesion molecule 5-like isoform X2 n=1 Tax=Ruditapes philippinarum TaxID=129788 RepID=UPI00295A633E|nr:carcinoembryonic antigen-related cell adhesion molecule 5-like isoform X2 [Ruditapes philippinarum]
MDSLPLIYSILFSVLIIFKDVTSFTLTASKSADKAILGDNPFTLSCAYTLTGNEQLFTIELERKRDTVNTEAFETILTFQNPSSPLNFTYQDTALEDRTVATKPTEESKTATLVFNTIECDDKATYNCKALYTDGAVKTAVSSVSVLVRANTLFEKDKTISHTPSASLEEGDDVTFQCSGDVGNEPVGHLGWFYYLNNDTSFPINASDKAVSQAPVYQPGTCSYKRTSTLQLKMLRSFNNILVRCTVQQDKYNQFGDGHAQTTNIQVYYPPKVTAIADKTVDEGTDLLTLNCVADANPPPTYSWLLPNGTVTDGQSVSLTNLEVGDNGTYTCLVYNIYKQVNHTANETVYIDVRKTTTPAPTTTPKITTGPTGGGEGTTVAQIRDGDDDDKTTLGIALGVSFGVIVIICIVVIVLCVMKKRRPKEIEEPPEKPRNNQDLSYYGNRPDLVSADHGMKNNMGSSALNSSFNNSFDSSDVKPRNEDGLLYIDLQFDDKPRSRRPIQILDNGSTPYADIVNPRV